MNQKFINLATITQKKQLYYQSQKSKRFVRKRSTQSTDRSCDSKNSKFSARQLNPAIKQFTLNQNKNNTKVHFNVDDFSSHLITSVMLSKQLTPSKPKYSRMRNQRNQKNIQQSQKQFDIDSHALLAELQVRNKQIQVLGSECKCLKQSLQQQCKKSKKFEEEKVELTSQINQKIKQTQKYQIQNKKLLQEKKILMKQIQFLQKINFDQKTRNVQSYREKYLQKEIEQLRKRIQMSKSDLQRQLEEEIMKISNQKYNIQNLNKALKVANETLIKNIERVKLQEKKSIFHSEEYVRLRQKYKMCLDAYKALKMEYCQLQREYSSCSMSMNEMNCSVQNILHENSELSIVLSSSSSQESLNLDKENKNLIKNNEIRIEEIEADAITPIKKSLSPRNRMEKSMSSPKSNSLKSPITNLQKKKIPPASYRYKSQSAIKQKMAQNSNFSMNKKL